jgi:hypothetical protein
VDLATEFADGESDRAFFRELLQHKRLLPPITSPYAPRRKIWSLVLLLFTIVESVYIPYMAAFQYPRTDSGVFFMPAIVAALQWIMDIMFWVDIVLMFRTTMKLTPVEGSQVVTDTKVIAYRYVRSGRFFLDFLAVLPIEFGAFAHHATQAEGAVPALLSRRAVTLRLFRLIHVYRFAAYHGNQIGTLMRHTRLFFFLLVAPRFLSCPSRDSLYRPTLAPPTLTLRSTALAHPGRTPGLPAQDALSCSRPLGRLRLVDDR